MPHVLAAQKGTLEGKRVLDIACNSGFFSIQCALLGAEVVGFDGRPDVIDHANFIKSIVGVSNADFRVLDFWDMDPESLGGRFDVVLNLGILYHLPKPLLGLERTVAMARDTLLLDTAVYPSGDPVVWMQWEEPIDIRYATERGVAAMPSKRSVELMLRHIGVPDWYEIPLRRGNEMRNYQAHKRASWLIEV
jgi:SAM-dependent methyltransferase